MKMKKKNLHKEVIIIGILVVVAVLVASIALPSYTASIPNTTKMEEGETTGTDVTQCTQEVNETPFVSRYDIQISFGDSTLTIFEGDKIEDKLRDIALYIEKMEIVSYVENTNEDEKYVDKYVTFEPKLEFSPNDYVLKYKSPITIPKSMVRDLRSSVNDNGAADSLLITFKSVSNDADPLCVGELVFDIAIDLTSFAEAEVVQIPDLEDAVPFTPPISESTIDCNNPQGDFAKSYCSTTRLVNNDKIKVQKFDYSSDLKGTEFDDQKKVTLKCDLTSLVDANGSVYNTENESEYFVNEAILTARKNTTKTGYFYEFNYGPFGTGSSSRFKTVSKSVDIKEDCTETVRVQYGPPVATMAGMCFEYNVKVTSTVTCTTNKIDPPPKPSYCTPVPECYHENGDWTGPAAGPSSIYDQCINACDGGKYTLSCSQKCYNSTYGSNTSKTANRFNQVEAKKVRDYSNVDCSKLNGLNQCLCYESKGRYTYTFDHYHEFDEGKNYKYYGCHYWNSDGSVGWYGGNDGTIRTDQNGGTSTARITPGRWFGQNYKSVDLSKYEVQNDGHIRKVFTSNLCGAACSWSGCDYDEKNPQYLNPAIAEVDYKENLQTYKDAMDYSKKVSTCHTTTTNFTVKVTGFESYITKADTLTSSYEKSYSIKDNEKLIGKNYLRDYKGCYQTSDINTKEHGGEWYQAVWGLPGVWIDFFKTQTISYKKVPGYTYVPNKFCLPYNLNTVNEKLWIYYYTNKYKGDKSVSYKTEEFETVCGPAKLITKVTESDVEDWNITASVTDFGHFKWNIDVKCFYSYADYITTPEKPECTSSIDNVVRSVDLPDLFPATDGGTHDSSTAGHTPPYNWSKNATQLNKDPNYQSDPVAYMKWVQSFGDNVWNDESEIDYRIYLTRSDIAKVREHLKNNEAAGITLTDYDPSGKLVPKSVVNYKSKLLREVLRNSKNKLPNADTIYCNNIHGNECLSFGKGDES